MTTLSDTVRTARKAHRCQLCFDPIEVGTRYRDVRGVEDGRGYTYRCHLGCTALGIAYMHTCREDGFDRASVREYLREYLRGELLALPEVAALDEVDRARVVAWWELERRLDLGEDAEEAEVDRG